MRIDKGQKQRWMKEQLERRKRWQRIKAGGGLNREVEADELVRYGRPHAALCVWTPPGGLTRGLLADVDDQR